MINLRKLYTTDEIALYGEKKLARQWHMTELLQMIAEAEEELNWSRAEYLQKYYNKLEQEQRDYEWIRSVADAALDGKPMKNETVPAGTETESKE